LLAPNFEGVDNSSAAVRLLAKPPTNADYGRLNPGGKG